MKTLTKMTAVIASMAIAGSSFAQLQDEQDVTMTMDLQPILQLKMEGPNQIDFTFDEINKYYTGITKTGANILKVSASVSFDLWAVGMSTGSLGAVAAGANLIWDNPVTYGNNTALTNNANNKIALTALELHQYPANPVTTALCATYQDVNGDYSSQFAPFAFLTGGLGDNLTNPSVAVGNNAIYCTSPTTPYVRPTNGAATLTEKYIAGAETTVDGCQVNAGSYLFGSFDAAGAVQNSTSAGVSPQTTGGYYFVMDYRILPGLPAKFPSTLPANNVNLTAPSILAADGAQDVNSGTAANVFAAPGVYTMFVKYVLAEDL